MDEKYVWKRYEFIIDGKHGSPRLSLGKSVYFLVPAEMCEKLKEFGLDLKYDSDDIVVKPAMYRKDDGTIEIVYTVKKL